jgi:PAS domain S-box-containing protein
MKQSFQEILSPRSYLTATEIFKEMQPELTGKERTPGWFKVIETEMNHKNGSFVWVESVINILRNADGNAWGIMGISRDITGRKHIENALRASEAKFRFLAENMNDIVWTADKDFTITYENPSIERILGYTPEERRGQDAAKLLTPESREKALNALARYLQQDKSSIHNPARIVKLDLEYLHKNGSIVWLESITSGIRDEEGRLTGFHGVSRDITERKRAEAALQASEAKYRILAECMDDIVWIADLDYKVTYESPSLERILGYTPEEHVGQGALSLLTPESQRIALDAINNYFEEEKSPGSDPARSVKLELEYYHKNGSIIWMESITRAIRDKEEKITGYHGLSRDITERKRSEEALHASEAKYRRLHESMMESFVRVDMTGMINEYNKSYVDMLGYSAEELLSLTYKDITPEKWHRLEDSIVEKQVLTRGYSDVYEKEYLRKDGSVFPIELRANLIRDDNGNPAGMWAIIRDISERKRSEAALHKSETKYRLLADSMNDIIWITDANFTITYVTPSVVRILGYTPEERIGQNPTSVLTPEAQKTAFEAFFQFLEQERVPGNDPKRTVKLELQYIRKDGSVIWMESVNSAIRDKTGKLLGFHGAARDINKRKLAEEELERHREELESLIQKRTRELSAANKRLKQENEVRKKTEGSLRYREAQLKKKKQELEEINSTLKILLKQRDEDKVSMENNIISNIKISVVPFLEKLEQSGLGKNQHLILSEIKAQIKEVTSPFIKKISSELLGLTTSEIQVASLIKEGKSSHEIAGIMNVSLNTIITHRYNIRRKTGLKNNKINLCSYLQTLE